VLPDTPVPPRWWTQLGSDKLNALVETALKASNDIAVADATLRQAQELAARQAAGSFRRWMRAIRRCATGFPTPCRPR
jgi:outer membrane protein TolC